MSGFSTFTRISPISAAAFLGFAAFHSAPIAAADRIFPLYIKNIDSQPVTVTISTDNNNCYEGNPGLGTIFQNIAPGASVKITLARVQGHGCNGHQGEFDLAFDPSVGVQKTRHLDFDNEGGLELSTDPKWINQYPGTLSAKSPQDGSYTFFTFKTPTLTAGKAMGAWMLACQGMCNRSYSSGISVQHSRENKTSSEVTTAVKISLESGVEFDGISAKTSVESSLEKKIGQEMAISDTHGESTTDTVEYKFTPEEMQKYNIFAVWQWIAITQLSDSTQVTVKSNKFTCTSNGLTPSYLPGTPEDVKACRGS